MVALKNVDIKARLKATITTLSTEKRVRNYSEFTRKRVAKKTEP